MKSKKIRNSHEDDGRKQKQISVPKKRRLLKIQSRMNDDSPGSKKWPNKIGSKLKKKFKKLGNDRSDINSERNKGSGRKSVSFSDNLENHKKSKANRKPRNSIQRKGNVRPLSKATRQKKAKLQKNLTGSKQLQATISGKRKWKEGATDGKPTTILEGEPEAKRPKMCELKVRDRKKIRKEHKSDVFSTAMAAKKIWEVIRRDDCTEEKKTNLLSELMNLIKGQVNKLIFAHDTVRVIECIVAVGTQEQRTHLFEELKASCNFIFMAKSKYAKFFLVKILNYGTREQKDLIINSFKGELVSLVKHNEAALVVETAFNEYANAKQRSEMVQEFYGPSFTLFKDEEARNLDDVLEKHQEQKHTILNNIKEMLLKITEKSVIRHSIVHHVLREFMRHADAPSRSEIIENIREAIPEILHTKDGARVAMNCLWHGTVKDRKKITKSLKMHVCKIAKEEHGSLVLIALFDCVDDTKLVQQVIINKLCDHFLELAQDLYGRKVLLYLLCPRDAHYFHPDVINILKAGDNNLNSKKMVECRREELKTITSPLLLKLACEHVDVLIKTNPTCVLLLSILQNCTGDRTETLESLASQLLAVFHPKKGQELHPLEQPAMHFLMKKLLQCEKNNTNIALFSEVLINTVPEGVMKTWPECNRGAFLLLNLFESGVPSVILRVREEMKGLHNHLSSKDFKGAKLLLAELKKTQNV